MYLFKQSGADPGFQLECMKIWPGVQGYKTKENDERSKQAKMLSKFIMLCVD